MPFLMLPWQADDRARAFAQDVADALDATMLRKVAADLMDIKEPLLSKWLSADKPVNGSKLTKLSDEFWDALLERLAARRGGYYFKPDAVLLLKGAASLRKPMAKMLASLPAERKLA